MKRRTRAIAGMIATMALAFSLAETVTASLCLPGPSISGFIGHTEEVPAGDDCMRMLGSRDEAERGDRGERDCPFGPVPGAPGCTAPVSAPSHGLEGLTFSPENAATVASGPMQHDVLLAATFFHPPKS